MTLVERFIEINGWSTARKTALLAGIGLPAFIVLAALAVTATVLAFFAVDTLRNAPETFVAILVILILAIALDTLWRRVRGPLPASVNDS